MLNPASSKRAQRGHINSGQLELDILRRLSTHRITDRAQERKPKARTSRGYGTDTEGLKLPRRTAGRVRIVGVRKKIARRIFKREAREFVLAEPEAMPALALTAQVVSSRSPSSPRERVKRAV